MKKLRTVLSLILILSMLITSSSLTKATEWVQEDDGYYDVDSKNIPDRTTESYLTDQEEKDVVWSQDEENNLTYEDDEVIISLESHGKKLSDDVKLNVTPILVSNPKTKGEYTEANKALRKNMAKNGYQVTGNVIYDIHLEDATGKEVDLEQSYKITFEYKEAFIPKSARKNAGDAEVQILQLVKNAKGEITHVSNLTDTEQVKDVELSGNNAVNKAELEVRTGEFSIVWTHPVKSSDENTEADSTTQSTSVTTEGTAVTSVEETTGTLTWEQEVEEDTVSVSAEDGALPKEAKLVVKAIKDKKELADITNAVEEKASEENFQIKTITAYDISFYVNDEEVQPNSPVQVKINTANVEKGDNADVYHVDEENKAEEMQTEVNKKGEVEFEAPHFSTYVLVNKTQQDYTVTINHFINGTHDKIYTTDVRTIPSNQEIDDYNKATNWEVAWVAVSNPYQSLTAQQAEEIEITANTTINVYYTPKTVEDVKKPVTFYDYMVGTKQNTDDGDGHRSYIYSWNTPLSINSLMPNWQQRGTGIAAGSHEVHQYKSIINNQGRDANRYFGQGVTNYNQMFKNLLNNIDLNDEVNGVHFNYDEPGFFVNQDNSVWYNNQEYYRRKLYKDFKLDFEQVGDTYTLKSVSRNGEVKTTAGANFFPLDDVETNYARTEDIDRDNNNHFDPKNGDTSHMSQDRHYNNNYYGMRYDVDFTLGDYLGELKYHFTGDDDLWAVLTDNTTHEQKVIMDIGGIHGACTNEVNIWKVLLNTDQEVTVEQKEEFLKTHKDDKYTLTVLYMERGAGYANCYMDFVLPNAQFKNPVGIPTADFNIRKKDYKDNSLLSGAEFTLEEQGNTGWRQKVTTGEDGIAAFGKLHIGTYTLTETKAPAGYVNTKMTWEISVEAKPNDPNGTTVKVTPQGSSAVNNYDGSNSITYDITNAKSEDTYIRVQKEITGISDPMSKLEGYSITVKDAKDQTQTLTLDSADRDGNTFTWKISGEDVGSYTVKESNANISGYKLTATLNGDTWSTPETETTKRTRTTTYEIRNVGHSPFGYDSNANFLISAFNNNKKEYVIWTKDALSANEREAFLNACASSGDDKLAAVAASDAKRYFFEGYGKNATLQCYGGITVKESGTAIDVGQFIWDGDTFSTGIYAPATTVNNPEPELKLTNTYSRTLQVTKNWSDGNNAHQNDRIYVGLYKKEGSTYTPTDKWATLYHNHWTGSFDLTDDSEYVVRELRKTVASETADFQIEGEGDYTAAEDGTLITAGEKTYQVSYDSVTTDNNGVSTQTITNTKKAIAIQLNKVGSEDTVGLPNAEFKLIKGKSVDNKWSSEETDGQVLRFGDESTYTIADLSVGYVYKLEETKAPEKYMLLSSPIYIKTALDNGEIKVSLMEEKNGSLVESEDGNILDTIKNSHIKADKMVTLTYDSTENINKLYVRNEALYELPQSGGRGIFIYMFGGILCMLSAAFIWYQVLLRKSYKNY